MHPNVVLNYTRSDGVSVQASDRAIRWVSKALGPLQSIDFRTTRFERLENGDSRYRLLRCGPTSP